jgi:hypothetical protein
VKYFAGNVAVVFGAAGRDIGSGLAVGAAVAPASSWAYQISIRTTASAPVRCLIASLLQQNSANATAVAGWLTFALRANASHPATKTLSTALRRLVVQVCEQLTPDFDGG